MFRRRTMFVKKVYNFQVDQVWSVQVGVVEAFDHLISDDYVNLFVQLIYSTYFQTVL